ncbi:hypothetical protein C8J57DRAFT_1509438 [Mycena rebaudengoi]|nr:hypothetical protein C8J57DRAFT_1509438 [Mycena rebaudengoi]
MSAFNCFSFVSYFKYIYLPLNPDLAKENHGQLQHRATVNATCAPFCTPDILELNNLDHKANATTCNDAFGKKFAQCTQCLNGYVTVPYGYFIEDCEKLGHPVKDVAGLGGSVPNFNLSAPPSGVASRLAHLPHAVSLADVTSHDNAAPPPPLWLRYAAARPTPRRRRSHRCRRALGLAVDANICVNHESTLALLLGPFPGSTQSPPAKPWQKISNCQANSSTSATAPSAWFALRLPHSRSVPIPFFASIRRILNSAPKFHVPMASPGMGATDVACIRRGRPRFCQEGPLRTAVPRGTPYQRILRMAVSAQYARQANLHGRAFTVPPRATLRRSLAVPPPPSPSPRKPAMALTDEVMRPGRNVSTTTPGDQAQLRDPVIHRSFARHIPLVFSNVFAPSPSTAAGSPPSPSVGHVSTHASPPPALLRSLVALAACLAQSRGWTTHASASAPLWTLDIPPPQDKSLAVLLASKANSEIISLSNIDPDNPALQQAVKSSSSGAIKIFQLIGALLRHKDGNGATRISVVYSTTGMVPTPKLLLRLSSFLFHHLIMELVAEIIDGKMKSGYPNHVKKNLMRGLKCTVTMAELVALALYDICVPWRYMTIVRGMKETPVNLLLLPDLRRKLLEFCTYIAKSPQIIPDSTTPIEKITIDGLPILDDLLFLLIQQLCPDLPNILIISNMFAGCATIYSRVPHWWDVRLSHRRSMCHSVHSLHK